MLVTVRALKPFVHDGETVAVGDHVQTTVIDALRLSGQRKVSLSLSRGGRLRASTSDTARQADDFVDEMHVHRSASVLRAMDDDESSPPSPPDDDVVHTRELTTEPPVAEPTRRRVGRKRRRAYQHTTQTTFDDETTPRDDE